MNKKLKKFKVHYLHELPSDENTKEQIKNIIGIKRAKIIKEEDLEKKTLSNIFKPIMISASAFILGVGCLIFIVSMVMFQNVPVYKGMSAENISASQVYLSQEGNHSQFIEDEIGIEVDNQIVCYAKPNEEIIISIKIDNPKPYEIISFTLNGILYSSYQFLKGSDATNILVKFVVQRTSGIQKITIDAIKYIKNTSIKSVRFDGDKAINLGITYIDAPSASMSNLEVDENNFAINLNLKDINDLVKEKGFIIYLFDEESLVETKSLHNGDNYVEFTNLKLDSKYYYAIVGVFDLYDGAGKKAHILLEGTLETLKGLNYKEVVSTHNSISLNYDVVKDLDIIIKNISLYDGEELIDQICPLNESFKFSGLMSNTNYTIKTTYEYPYNGDVIVDCISYEIKTKEIKVPCVILSSAIGLFSTIYADIIVDDDNNLISSIWVELYSNDNLVQTIEEVSEFDVDSNGYVTSHITFNDVLNGEYLIVVCYKYNLNDGKGDIVINRESIDVDNTITVVLD